MRWDLRALNARFDALQRVLIQVGRGADRRTRRGYGDRHWSGDHPDLNRDRKSMRTRAWLGAVLAVTVALWMVPTAGATAGSRSAAIVSLGDSFISGEGGRWLGNGSEPSGPDGGRPGGFGCAGWLCEYDPARVYGASEANDCHRSDVAPIRSAPVGCRGEGRPRLFGGAVGERVAGGDGRAVGISASRRRPTNWPRWPGVPRCG